MSQKPLRFDGKVAIVTGAGGGLGRVYALDLAARGAKVVVNDLGVTMRGEGKDTSAADKVVQEIKAAGGDAVANYDSVTEGAKIVQTAIDKYGRVDIVINNAGILRDVSFIKMEDKDWQSLYEVHLKGSYSVTRAAWPHMRKNKYGRIIMVASAAGLYGNFGQAHYSSMKMGLLGLSNSLAKEGAKLNIFCNTIAPAAGSRMTETVLPPELVAGLKPEFVSPVVAYLVHDSCNENGGIFELGAGWVAKLRWERASGAFFPLDSSFTPERVEENWAKVGDFSLPAYPTTPQDSFVPVVTNLEMQAALKAQAAQQSQQKVPPAGAEKKASKKSNVDVEKALAYRIPPTEFTYTDRDVMLYALGVGAAANPNRDLEELKFTYENHAQFQVLPTFGVIIGGGALGSVMAIPGLEFNPMMLLHGEQYMELKKPLPVGKITLVNYPKIAGVYDKTSGALVLLDVSTKDEKGEEVVFNQYSLFIRGIGGFGGDKGPKQEANDPPARPPDVVHREKTTENQALLYRLSGDYNPLHADPEMAKMGGFDKPILHGLCSFGFAMRAVLKHFCDNDVTKFKSIRVRFSKHVFPGETLVTEMWKLSDTRIVFRVKAAERGEYVLSNCLITLVGDKGPSPAVAAAAAAAQPAKPAAKPSSSGPAASSAGASVSASGFQSAAVFEELKKRLNGDLVNKVKATYRFDVTAGDKTKSWLINLKTGSGSITEEAGNADCTFIIKDADLVQLMTGKLNAQQAFMKGQVKIKGNLMLAQKLGLVVGQQSKL